MTYLPVMGVTYAVALTTRMVLQRNKRCLTFPVGTIGFFKHDGFSPVVFYTKDGKWTGRVFGDQMRLLTPLEALAGCAE